MRNLRTGIVAALWACAAACSVELEVERREVPVAQDEAGSRVFDHSELDRVLERFVTDEGMVRYPELRREREGLDRYVGELAAASPRSHPELFPEREHEIAYWINAYNALMLRAVVDAYPVESPLDIARFHGVFSRYRYPVGRERLTLDDVEKGILLEEYDEPRVHFALSCASMSCPRLDRRAFQAESLSERLDEEGREFLRSDEGIRILPEEGRVLLSRYFDWYEEDFRPDPLAYARPYLDEEQRAALDAMDDPEVEFLDYDWRLNDASAPWAP